MTHPDDNPELPEADQMHKLLKDAIDAWPQFETDTPVNGGDLVDWFAQWRLSVKACIGPDRN